MTDQEIKVAIAEACGWKHVRLWVHDSQGVPVYIGTHPNGNPDVPMPDYCSDLNAMAKAEKTLQFHQWRFYSDKLMAAVRDSDVTLNGSNIEARYKTPHATARQRAEAFLRTIGKWVDDPVNSVAKEPQAS